MSRRYSIWKLEQAVSESITFAEVLRRLGKKWSGGQQQNIKKWIKRYEIDTSHFLGQAANKGKKSTNRKHWSEILMRSCKACPDATVSGSYS